MMTSTIFITAEIPAQIIGILVSSQAIKPGVRTLSKTNAGKPKANRLSAYETLYIVSDLKAPRS